MSRPSRSGTAAARWRYGRTGGPVPSRPARTPRSGAASCASSRATRSSASSRNCLASGVCPMDWDGSIIAAGLVHRSSVPSRRSSVSAGPGSRSGFYPGREVGVERGECLPRACGAGSSPAGRRTRAKRSRSAPAPAVVVRTHPPHELAVGRGLPDPWLKPRAMTVVEGARARDDVVVDDQAHHAVALDRDRPVALLLDELPEEIVPSSSRASSPWVGSPKASSCGGPESSPRTAAASMAWAADLMARGHAFNAIVEPPS